MDSVILSSERTGEFVELSAPHLKTTGKLYKKMIFRWGDFSHPRNPKIKINVDNEFFTKLKKNFESGVCPIVPFPSVNEKNEHVESVERNLGQIVDLTSDEEGVYALIDVRKHSEDIGNTILGASAKVHLNYMDRKSGTVVGPTLIHVAATNNPFLTDLAPFETVEASNADTTEEVVLLTDSGDNNTSNNSQEEPMTKEEMLAALSDEYGIDVEAGQLALSREEGYLALSDVIEGENVVASPEVISQTIVDLSNSITERDEKIEAMSAELQTIHLSRATDEVENYIKEGRILPKSREAMIELSMNDREKFEVFLLPEELAQVEFSEQGFSSAESTHEEDPADKAKAIAARLASYVQDSTKKENA